MLIPLLIGSALVFANMVIQIVAMLAVIRLLLRRLDSQADKGHGLWQQARSLSTVVLVLFVGHVVQFAIWAALFVYIGEFDKYSTSFYFSAVSFTSLGYGDIVMSEAWRVLGPLEAANGVLMFGLSAGAILSLMTWMLKRQNPGVANPGAMGNE